MININDFRSVLITFLFNVNLFIVFNLNTGQIMQRLRSATRNVGSADPHRKQIVWPIHSMLWNLFLSATNGLNFIQQSTFSCVSYFIFLVKKETIHE